MNKKYQVANDIIERNLEFINKKNEKIQKKIMEEKESLTFSPVLISNKSSKKLLGVKD
jgi:hypothetical protein